MSKFNLNTLILFSGGYLGRPPVIYPLMVFLIPIGYMIHDLAQQIV